MLAPLLGALVLKCDNTACRPVMDAIDLLARYASVSSDERLSPAMTIAQKAPHGMVAATGSVRGAWPVTSGSVCATNCASSDRPRVVVVDQAHQSLDHQILCAHVGQPCRRAPDHLRLAEEPGVPGRSAQHGHGTHRIRSCTPFQQETGGRPALSPLELHRRSYLGQRGEGHRIVQQALGLADVAGGVVGMAGRERQGRRPAQPGSPVARSWGEERGLFPQPGGGEGGPAASTFGGARQLHGEVLVR
ncbi:hypothetical protein [Nonomuraea sp. GTA35]|uniref:hypothetical protein n=1 Tax=Nonomuraea sp. GTA35 TaxID=1676746 RepID=UPI0035C175AA